MKAPNNVAVSFLDKRHENPDYSLEVWITGVRMGDQAHWYVRVEDEDDPDLVAGILERAVEVLRDKDIESEVSKIGVTV